MATNKPAATGRRNKPGPKPKNGNGDAAAPAAPAAPKPGAFKFDLKANVSITASGEKGTVRGRAEYASGNLSYYVAYTSATGEYREAWIDQDMLTGFVERRKRPVKVAAPAAQA